MDMKIYDPKAVEKEVEKLWEKKKIPQSIVKFNEKGKKFYLLDGPPYINDVPHVGHIRTTTLKDVWGKFKSMQGFAVWFQPGFDCGGLPIENAVEKRLGIKSKDDIERIGVERFIEECKRLVKGNEPEWLLLYKKLGAWRGWSSPYLTSENYYLESGLWTIKRLFEKGLLVSGFMPGFWCPRCETVLSGYEVTDSYRDLEDPSIFILFPIKNKKEYLLVWTTTPWTLPANVAICIHPDKEYVKVRIKSKEHCGKIIILAKERLKVLKELGIDYAIIEGFPGKKLGGIEYEPLLDVPLQRKLNKENAHRVVLSIPIMKKRVAGKVKAKKQIREKEEFGHVVDMLTGSGLVHIAPGHGDIDNKLGKHYNLPEPSPVDEKGCLTDDAGEFAGLFVKDADKLIINYLKQHNLLLNAGKILHSYPLCWRCKTPLIYRMSDQWFLKLSGIRQKILKENKKLRWLPLFARERFHNLIEDSPDWAITRQRYWGIPLPVWRCERCEKKRVIGSVKELRRYATKRLPKRIDLHKDSLDKIKLKCDCGSEMERLPDVMSVWFDSGISTWASLGYPFKNKKLFEHLMPIDLVAEGQDHIRGWFYYLMLCSMATFGKKPFETVCVSGWILDEKGEKMSKSIGNVILAKDAYNELGADLLRLYYCYDVAPWITQKFNIHNAKELGGSLNILWNVYSYFKTYAKLKTRKPKLRIEDRWILSKLNSLIISVTDNLENFSFHQAGRDIICFVVNELSRTYIKLIRGRNDKADDYTLTTCLENVLRLLAPITPFITEYIHYDLFKKSVHLAKWPIPDKRIIDKSLEKDMAIVNEITATVNAVRKENRIKLRWPLPLLIVELKQGMVWMNELKPVLEKLCNVKRVMFGKGKKTNMVVRKEKNFIIYLDLNVDENEALLRELLREIQERRKKVGLVVNDRIVLYLDNKKIKHFASIIKKRVGAKKIKFGKIEKEMGIAKYKDNKVRFWFDKIK